jgi:hypothetical protein
MNVHYLGIVSPDVETVCRANEAVRNVTFGTPDNRGVPWKERKCVWLSSCSE